jgi:hypothetical protein
MVAALYAAVAGQPRPARPTPFSRNGHEVIAYFPQITNANSEFDEPMVLDFPHGEPELAKALMRPFPQRTLLYRIVNYLTGPSLPHSYETSGSEEAPRNLSPELLEDHSCSQSVV